MKYRKLGSRSFDWVPIQAAATAPGWNADSSKIGKLDGNDHLIAGLPDEVMVELLEQIPHPICPYVPGAFDCENFARWYASQAAELWGRLQARGDVTEEIMLLDQGVVTGKLPVGELPAGNHAANFFFNDKGVYRMWEPQERRLLLPEEVAKSELIWKLEYH